MRVLHSINFLKRALDCLRFSVFFLGFLNLALILFRPDPNRDSNNEWYGNPQNVVNRISEEKPKHDEHPKKETNRAKNYNN